MNTFYCTVFFLNKQVVQDIDITQNVSFLLEIFNVKLSEKMIKRDTCKQLYNKIYSFAYLPLDFTTNAFSRNVQIKNM